MCIRDRDRRLGEPLPHQLPNLTRANPSFPRRAYRVLLPVSQGYPQQKGIFPRVTHPSAAHPEGRARLACVRPAASVRSEPGSNSQVDPYSALIPCLLYTSPSPRDRTRSRMPSSA
eukprot:TRINITY_DN376_c0_g1_i5.p1 TRINITY_DN376_c0_g1~~TRINITY_DN376_c0_g1_i5.p1  ORF type:complete len:116 (-),score=9.16 TRINITY_DN376_c0_g1_i5:139-486(-)